MRVKKKKKQKRIGIWEMQKKHSLSTLLFFVL